MAAAYDVRLQNPFPPPVFLVCLRFSEPHSATSFEDEASVFEYIILNKILLCISSQEEDPASRMFDSAVVFLPIQRRCCTQGQEFARFSFRWG